MKGWQRDLTASSHTWNSDRRSQDGSWASPYYSNQIEYWQLVAALKTKKKEKKRHILLPARVSHSHLFLPWWWYSLYNCPALNGNDIVISVGKTKKRKGEENKEKNGPIDFSFLLWSQLGTSCDISRFNFLRTLECLQKITSHPPALIPLFSPEIKFNTLMLADSSRRGSVWGLV